MTTEACVMDLCLLEVLAPGELCDLLIPRACPPDGNPPGCSPRASASLSATPPSSPSSPPRQRSPTPQPKKRPRAMVLAMEKAAAAEKARADEAAAAKAAAEKVVVEEVATASARMAPRARPSSLYVMVGKQRPIGERACAVKGSWAKMARTGTAGATGGNGAKADSDAHAHSSAPSVEAAAPPPDPPARLLPRAKVSLSSRASRLAAHFAKSRAVAQPVCWPTGAAIELPQGYKVVAPPAKKPSYAGARAKSWAKAKANGKCASASLKAALPPPPPPPRLLTRVESQLLRGMGLSKPSEEIQVLARHAARLGSSASGFEMAVRRVLTRGPVNAALSLPDTLAGWDFFTTPERQRVYLAEKKRFEEVYTRLGRTPKAEQEARQLCDGLGRKPMSMRASQDWSAPRAYPSGLSSDVLELPIGDVRWAHDRQSERFGKGTQLFGSILQLAIELIGGLTDVGAVPLFDVCRHEKHWYCRSGHRRLAAFCIANRFAPRLRTVKVRKVDLDETFTNGTFGRTPKLTTHRNGEDCEGRWMVLRETGESVSAEEGYLYGADLLIPLVNILKAAKLPPFNEDA
eukprot:NODE_3119_length_2089_cov_9.680428.p1 GENE.NODE_3119_length_2089_cov_9.680428~~NODE_3119_length_2089_cov_9.680428.p1  ORF type:complete len:575 (-),score=86.70 NODE_3119_length_2089_cov_9.680428:288-2012(-)